MARLELTLLGGFLARLRGEPLTLPTRKTQALLAYLALPLGQAHQRDKLATLLWGGTPDASARNSFRQALFVLRKRLAAADDLLEIEGDTVALNGASVEVDALGFERAVMSGTPAELEKAAIIYQGDLLAGLAVDEAPFEEWLRAERERLRELALEGLAKLLAYQRSAGPLEGAIRTALRLTTLDPLQESAQRTLMRLFVRSGRRGAALQQYQQCVSVLQRELGAEPEAETQALYGEILRARSWRQPQDEAADRELSRGSEEAVERRRTSGTRDVVDAESRLVGRDVEVAQLGRALDHWMDGRGIVVAIVGEAGVGKTSLLATLDAAARQRGAQVVAGRCYESAQVLPFGPWAEAFRGDDKALRACVEMLDPIWQAELARILPEVGVAGLPVVGDDRLRLFEAVGRLVEALAGAQPLLIALEDVHWADEMSLRLLSFLARRRDPNILIVITSREEEMFEAPVLLSTLDELYAQASLVRMNLAPLSREDTGVLVRALARPGTNEAALERLTVQAWAVSEGNPFVIIEALRAFREGAEARSISGLPMPERVRRLLETRIARLGERAQCLLAVAAVIGREFEFALLQRAADLSDLDAARCVEELVRRRLLQVVGERLDFTHDRIRNVVYHRLLLPSRTVLHTAVARAIEAVYAPTLDVHAPALGLHYREGAVWDRAVIFLTLAGAQALSRSAYGDAAIWYEQALAGLTRLPATRENLERIVDARIGLGSATYYLGKVATSAEHLEQAENIAEGLGDARRLGRALSFLTLHALISGRPSVVKIYGERTLAIAEEADDVAARAMANYYLGHGRLVAGELGRAIARFRDVALVLEDATNKNRFPPSSNLRAGAQKSYLAWCLAESGQFTEAIEHGLDAIRSAEASEIAHWLVQAWSTLTYVHTVRGEYGRAVELSERALGLTQARELALFLPLQQWLVGYTWARSDRMADGLPLIRAGLEQLEAWGLWRWVPLVLIHLGEVCLLAGLIDEPRAHAARGLGLARELGQRLHEAYALRLLGDSLARDHAEDAEEAYRAALALAEELGLRPLVAHCHLGFGRLCRRTGKRQQAQEHLTTATAMYRQMDMPYWLDQAKSERSR